MKKVKNSQAIKLHVFAYRKAAELPVQLGVTPEVLNLSQFRADDDITVSWQIVTTGYRFPDNGTAIVFTSPGSKKAFGRVKVTEDCLYASVQVMSATSLAYAYTISVIDDATGLTAVLDPVIVHPTR